MKFLEWNEKLAAHFFRPEVAGRQVFLYVTEELLDELGEESDAWRQFVQVVKVGHHWRSSDSLSLCRKALDCLQTWRGRGLQYPAYIAYLGLFVLAGGKEGNFAPNAYYPKLWKLIGESGSGMPSEFNRMRELWEDLEWWATDERGGELGLFTFRSIGGWAHVGIPRAQALLTAQERYALPGIFAAAHLDPTSSPSDFELRRVLRVHGASVLRHRTMNVLTGDNADEDAALQVLLAAAREELEQWDGHIEEPDQPAKWSVFGSLRLCTSLDRVARTARFSVRCSMNRDYPEAGLFLTQVGSSEQFRCEGDLLHWSTPLTDPKSQSRVDGAQFDWGAGAELREAQLGWRFRMQGCPVRILVNGESEGLRGFVEVHQLSPGLPFLLAARSDTWEKLEAWGASSCRQFERVEVRDLDWARRDYEVRSLQFRMARASADEVRLSVYEHPVKPATLCYFWHSGAYREVDRDWGRYALLRHAGVEVLVYDPRQFVLLVPSGAPLPRLFARACVLCSGHAPRFVRRGKVPLASRERIGFHVFRGVPPVVARTLAGKLRQRLTITKLGPLPVE
jgi:hypothetical protein